MKMKEPAISDLRGWHASAASMPEASRGLEEGSKSLTPVSYQMWSDTPYRIAQSDEFAAGLGAFGPLPYGATERV